MRRRGETLISIVCLVGLVSILLYAFVTISTLSRQSEELIYEYNILVQVHQAALQKEHKTSTTEMEEETLELWNTVLNIDTITWKEAEEADIRDEYIKNRVANLVNKLAHSMSGFSKYKDKQSQIQAFIDEVEMLQKELGRKHIALEDAKLYGKYLLKIFK